MKKYLLFGFVLLILCYSFLGREVKEEKLAPKQINPHLQKWIESCEQSIDCLLYTSPSPRDQRGSRMPSSA